MATQDTAKLQGPAYRRNPQGKRAAIAKSALALFSAKGYENTSTAQIARQAGTSEGTLFNHFGSKRGLFEYLAEDYARKSAAAIILEEGEALTEEDVVRRAFDFCDAHDDLYRLFSLQYADSKKRGLVIDLIEVGIKGAMVKGNVRLGNPKIMAELQFALIEQAYRFYRQSEDLGLREAYIIEAISAMKSILRP